MQKQLPEQFKDLQSFADQWALSGFDARYAKRASVEMAELQNFYDTLLPAMPRIMEFLHQQPYGEALPPPIETLMNLAMSFMDVSPAVELFFQPTVLYGKDYRDAALQIHC